MDKTLHEGLKYYLRVKILEQRSFAVEKLLQGKISIWNYLKESGFAETLPSLFDRAMWLTYERYCFGEYDFSYMNEDGILKFIPLVEYDSNMV